MFNDGNKVMVIIICTFIFWILAIGLIGVKSVITKEEAIKNNCAQYNPITAEFEWIKKPVDLISGGVE